MKFDALVVKLNKICGHIGAWLSIPLVVVVTWEVITRYVFNNPTDWVYDAAWMIFSVMFLLGGGYTLAEDRHVRVDIIFRMLPARLQALWDCFFFIVLFLPIMGILTWRGLDFAIQAWKSGEMLSTTLFVFPSAPVKSFIPLGFALLGLQGIVELRKNIRILFSASGGDSR